MTSTPARGVDRVPGASGRPPRALSTIPAIALLLLAGFALRFTIAYILFPGSGFGSDISSYKGWADAMAHFGPGGFYANVNFADYPPGYLYVLWPLGLIAQAARNLGIGTDADYTTLIKLPAMLADLAIGYLLYRMVKGWSSVPGRNAVRLGLIAAAIYLFNPVTWYDSAIWGQTDAVGALVMLVTLALLLRGHSEGATAGAVLALTIKPQFGLVMLPIVAAVLLRRHLLAPGTGPRHRPRLPGRLADWLVNEQGWPRLLSSALVGFVVLLAIIVPFGFDPISFAVFIGRTASEYTYLSTNAYNPWALIGSGGAAPLASGGGWSNDLVGLLGPISGFGIGTALLVIGFLVGFFRLLWRADRWSIVVVAAFLSLCFFILPTRVHERYAFPVFAFLPLLAVAAQRWRTALVAMAVGSFINLHGILLTSGYGTDNLQGLPYGDTFRTFPWIVASVLLQTGVFIFVAWQMRRSAVAHPDPLARVVMAGGVSAVPPLARDPLDADGGDAATGAAAGTGPALWPGSALDASTGSAASAVAPLGDLPPVVWDNEGSSVLRWFEGKLRVPMLRRDRSKELDHEPVGRLDKLDLFIVILVVVAAMALRTYRLGEPFDMHFDEVYHARTATEFLQDWRYGEPHSIYEFTHPHIAKYSIAIGLILFGDDQVTATADLGADVTDAALETRWSPADDASERDGDRLYLATGSDVRVYDLAERDLVATLPIAAQAVAVDEGSHTLFAADAGGTVWSFSTLQLDDLRRDASHALPLPTSFATLPSKADQVRSLEASDGSLIALASNGELVSLDGVTGDQTGETNVDGAAAVSRAPSASRIVVDPAQVTDITKLATQLADILGDDPDRISALLTAATRPVTVAAYVDDATTTTLQNSIDAGTLAGTSIESGATVAVGGTAGVTVLDTVSLDSLQTVDTDAPVTGLVLDSNCGCGDANVPTVYAASASDLVPIAIRSTGPSAGQALTMPGVIRDVYLDASSNMIHAVGEAPDDSGMTVYVVETHGNAVYADARLPFDPRAVVMDIQPDRPADDRQDLLAFSATGSMASVDIGSHAFAWRLPGVIMGALMAAGIYLLARFFFRRRSIGLLAALLTLVEGMAFANSRIAMNDTYVAAFIVLALVLFVPLYLGIWKRRLAVALVLPLVGILLGLALGSKWVGAYAMGVVVLAILLRSALGRIIALVGMIGMTGVLGWLGLLADPSTVDPHRDYLFLGLMVVLTVMLAVAMVRRPVRFTLDELRFVVVGPAGLGGLLVLAGLAAGPPAASASAGVQSPNGLMLAGAALLFLAALAYGATWLLARFGIGPLAPPRPTRVNDIVSSPSPEGWLRPGWFGGIPWIYALGCMIIIPLVVYVISYIPWALLPGNRILNDWPPGHNGQTLLDLTQAMYNYHNDLRAGHAASSPWWAWPLDLKPVWFYQDSFANSTTGVIYDSGNLVIFWLGIPAVIFASWQAWVRRSLPLTLIVLAMFGLWLPWARIDRATFQYHFFTSLPFVILALAYFLAELWHGASSRTFLLARVAGAIAILGPPILWLLREPLCSLAATNAIHPNGAACGPTPLSRSLDITDSTAAAIAVFVVAAIVIGELIRRQRGRSSSEPVIRFGDGASGLEVSLMVAILAVLTAAAVVIVATQFILSGAVVATMDLRADDFYVVVMLLLIGPAIYALRTRDPRRWVIAAVGSAVLWFIIWYPNLTGMPMPDSFGQAYLLLLPTWNYDFQFSVNLDAAYQGSVVVPETLWFTAAVIGICIFAMVLARGWRSGREVNPPE